MHVQQMSPASRQHVLANWLEMYASANDRNGILRQVTWSFPDFAVRMRNNLHVIGVDGAFERAMKGIFLGSAPVRTRRR
jgi:hypothetical protein